MSKTIKKVMVTGSNGQVGYLVTKKLAKLENIYEVYNFDRASLDITSETDVTNKSNEVKPDIIINCAAHTGVDKSETDIQNSFAINELGPKYLAKQATKHNALLIHISTDYVFDGNLEKPYLETDNPYPKGIYGQSKLAGEKVINEIGCKHVILRTAWVFGEHGNNFVKTMLKLGYIRNELDIISDQFGGPTYAGDIAEAIINISEQYQNEKQSGVYHFSGYPHVSWYEFACEIFEAANEKIYEYKSPKIKKISSVEYSLPAPRPNNSRLNCDKITKKFGITQSDWKQALANITQYKE